MTNTKNKDWVRCSTCRWRCSGAFEAMPADVARIIERAKKAHIQVKAGRVLMRPTAPALEFYALYEGWAICYLPMDGGRQIVHFCLPGDAIGVAVPLLGRVPYVVEALTEVSLCVFDAADYSQVVARTPAVAMETARIAASEAIACATHLANVGRRSAEARVAYLLLELFERLAIRDLVDGDKCDLPLTQEDIGDALGLSSVHVSRMLKILQTEGIALFERGVLKILDKGALARCAQITGTLAATPRLL